MSDIAKDISIMKDIVDLTSYVFELEEWLKLRMGTLTSDVNRLSQAHRKIMTRMKEDHDTIRLYLQQNKDFRKWAAKQTLETR